ncbi:hypothetical protein GAYE_SCF04G2401 [Galdieria yellowstonensis]|uniref:Ribosomal RNA large subunit methyltransferase H n=1 Tax=Galdieria yellowstonensis TaxID=3028027 RepID=A0AAV9IAP8_9RHOD|nr:hypothetical protein GAYE_SCF04G2401 [Galdieria yellowstonensis]
MVFVTTCWLSGWNKSVKSFLQPRSIVQPKNLCALFHVSILSQGKIKERWLTLAMEEYMLRLRPHVTIELLWSRDDEHLLQLVSRRTGCLYCLDPAGTTVNSDEFKKLLYRSFERGKVNFVIGGPEGLPKELKSKGQLLSLSQLTFTHQMTRLILVEQIYRATQIHKGTAYHK